MKDDVEEWCPHCREYHYGKSEAEVMSWIASHDE